MGHATRCIPIIQALLKANFEPVLASDGNALVLLQKEFPYLKSYALPSYNIYYSKKGGNLKLKLLFQVPAIISAVKKEKRVVQKIIEKEGISGIISDNRFGVFSKKIPSVYITHQLQVLSGFTTFLTSKTHQKFIKNFDECWVPDLDNKPRYSGFLSAKKNNSLNVKYIGILSRFNYRKITPKYNILVLLSGVEPQRTILENKLLVELKNYKGNVLFVRGVFNNTEICVPNNFEIVDFLGINELEEAINSSEMVISRSGYSTIMDLAVLGKKAFFIPTPGQYEQEYLAKMLADKLIAPFANQHEFTIAKLACLNRYSGFKIHKKKEALNLFKLFEGKGKF